MVELDVQPSSDGDAFVFHDDTLARLAGRPERFRETSSAVLRKIVRTGGGRIPTFREVVDWASSRRVALYVEMKFPPLARISSADDAFIDSVAAAASVLSRDRFFLASFHIDAVRRARARRPSVRIGWIFESLWFPFRSPLRRAADMDVLCPGGRFLSPRRAAGLGRGGRPVYVWTVDDEDRARRYARAGVAGIVTNDPARIRAALERGA